jgi:Flp pilus assembly protein TadD
VTSEAGSLFAAQDELAGEVLAGPRPRRATATPTTRAFRGPTSRIRYLRALGLLQRYDKSDSIGRRGDDCSSSSPRKRPKSPLVHAALGRAFLRRYTLTRDPSWAPLARSVLRARAAAARRVGPRSEVTLAQLATLTGEAPRAVALLRHVLSVQPGNSEALLALAQALDAGGDAGAAEEAYRRLITLQPGYWAAYSKLGVFYYRHGKFRDAAEMFRRVTELNPDSARSFSNLGGALQQAGGLRRGARRHPPVGDDRAHGVGLANLGTLQFYMGEFDEAARSFEGATKLMPSSCEVWAQPRRRVPLERRAQERGDRRLRARDPARPRPARGQPRRCWRCAPTWRWHSPRVASSPPRSGSSTPTAPRRQAPRASMRRGSSPSSQGRTTRR